MAEYLSPGVYMEEVNTGPRPIEGVGTAMAAFVGFAPAGPVNKPELITNWSQYVEMFGLANNGGRKNPHMAKAYLSHAVYGYFLNGGGRCYVTRVGQKTPTLHLPSRAAKTPNAFTLQAKSGEPGHIDVEVAPPTGEAPPDGTFTLKVKQGANTETYENVTLGRGKGGSKNVVELLKESKLVMVLEAQPGSLPDTGKYVLSATDGGSLPQVQPATLKGDSAARTGIEGLEIAEDATMVCCPDLMS